MSIRIAVICSAALVVTGCYRSHRLPVPPEEDPCRVAPEGAVLDETLRLEHVLSTDRYQLVVEDEDGGSVLIARLPGDFYDRIVASPDGRTAVVTGALTDHREYEQTHLVSLDSGEVREVGSELYAQAGHACGEAEHLADGTTVRGWWSGPEYRADGRRLLFYCWRSHFADGGGAILRDVARSAHELDLDTGAWRAVATECDFALYVRGDACTLQRTITPCTAGRLDFTESRAELIETDARRDVPEFAHGSDRRLLGRAGGGYLVRDHVGGERLLHISGDGTAERELAAGDWVSLEGISADGSTALVLEVHGATAETRIVDVRTGTPVELAESDCVALRPLVAGRGLSPDGARAVLYCVDGADTVTAVLASAPSVETLPASDELVFDRWEHNRDGTLLLGFDGFSPWRGAQLFTGQGEAIRSLVYEPFETIYDEEGRSTGRRLLGDVSLIDLAFRVARPR